MRAGWVPRRYRIVDPRTGRTAAEGVRPPDGIVPATGDGPRLVIFHDGPSTVAG